MTSDTILNAARWAHARYYQGRAGHTWDSDSNQLRWLWVTARVGNAEITTGQALHRAYWTGYDPRLAPAWDDLGTFARKRWLDVLRVMQDALAVRRATNPGDYLPLDAVDERGAA